MLCSNHFLAKYARFLIKYHLFIFCWIFIMTTICVVLWIYKRDQIHIEYLLKGFQAHGTKTSNDYRTLIALIRETQTTHLYPHSTQLELFQYTPYASFSPHINPCSKRFYLPTCQILNYTELTYEFTNKSATLLDDLDSIKAVCRLEWKLRTMFNINDSYCRFIGPMSFLMNENFNSSEQCEYLTLTQLANYRTQWISCNSSSCSNHRLHSYLKYLSSSSIFKIYINIDSDEIHTTQYLIDISRHDNDKIFLIHIEFDTQTEQILFKYFLQRNITLIYITIGLYVFCLLLFVKNIFFVIIILLHVFITLVSCCIIYIYILHFPITLLHYTSLILYLFIVLIDSFLWYTCWFVNNHRRDDCTVNRMIENLLTQTCHYLVPKNLTAIIILVITYTNQIIVIQCFVVFSCLLIIVSFCISFVLYPVSFVFVLRNQSHIPAVERILHCLFAKLSKFCVIDLTLPYLIVRLRAFWLALLSIISCIAFLIIFQWPALDFNACRITFDALPNHIYNEKQKITTKTLDVDITYYIGSRWEAPYESMIPTKDIPIYDYNIESKMTSRHGTTDTFEYNLGQSLSSLMNFCSRMSGVKSNEKHLSFNFNHTFINPSMRANHPSNELLTLSVKDSLGNSSLAIKQIHCFGNAFSYHSSSSLSVSKIFPIITYHDNQSKDCNYSCSSNEPLNIYECILCLNSLYYISYKYDDLFLIKNGLRFISDSQDPRYLLQTVNYQWNLSTNINNIREWQLFYEHVKNHFITKFYLKSFSHVQFWWSSELFSTYAIMEQLYQEKYFRIGIKCLIILIFLTLCTGVLGIFVTLTTLFNFVTCIAIFVLLQYSLTVEHVSYFTIVLIICSQYSVLYSISYKLAPTFFFQRENRTIYSLKQLCKTLFNLTFSVIVICIPCLLSSLPYLSKSAMILAVSSLISLIYSTFFLQCLLYYFGPSDDSCFLIPCRLKFICDSTLKTNKASDFSLRNSLSSTRRHARMSTSSYVPSSYFSQIFTGSTYFESEYSGLNDTCTIGSRRRESSRSHQLSHVIKRSSILTGEVIELCTPRASLAPHGYHRRYSRHSSVPRGVPTASPARPLYVSPSVSPYSQLSIHSQSTNRQRSPSTHLCRPSRSPSPRLSARAPVALTAGLLRPCYSAPRLHTSLHRLHTNSLKPNDILIEESPTIVLELEKCPAVNSQRHDTFTITSNRKQMSNRENEQVLTVINRNELKTAATATKIESTAKIWLKRSNSS